MTWGYKADVTHFLSPTSTNRVKDHAKSLLNALSALRNSPETSRRPIIFVTHSLGGLVCAQVGRRFPTVFRFADATINTESFRVLVHRRSRRRETVRPYGRLGVHGHSVRGLGYDEVV